MSTRKQQRSAPISTRKKTRLQQLYKRVTKSKANMVISAAIFATVMSIVGLFVTSKGAPLSSWTTLRDLLTKTGPGRLLAGLLQNLIDLVCGLLNIGLYPGCIVEFKEDGDVVVETNSIGKVDGKNPEIKAERVKQLAKDDQFVVQKVVGEHLELVAMPLDSDEGGEAQAPTFKTIGNNKKFPAITHAEILGLVQIQAKNPKAKFKFKRIQMKKTGKIEKEK